VGKPASKYFGPLYGRSLLADPALPADRYEVRLAKKGGDALVVQVSAQRVETEEGRHLGCFAVLMDITARANAEAALRRSESDLRLLSAQLLSAQELERQRIARELHDGIGQAMGGIKFSLESCAQSMAAGASPAHAERLRELAAKMQGVVEEVRRISMNLRPSTLDDLGILPTLGWFCREFQAVYGQFHVETMVDVLEDAIAPQVKTAIYRIVQEAFNNVVVHSRARNISLDLTIEDGLIELRIQDDGSGFEPKRFASTDDKARGLGLASMRERAEATGGRFRLVSERGRGTRIHARWPGPASAAQ
jgi:signal transduction histidine kinase